MGLGCVNVHCLFVLHYSTPRNSIVFKDKMKTKGGKEPWNSKFDRRLSEAHSRGHAIDLLATIRAHCYD